MVPCEVDWPLVDWGPPKEGHSGDGMRKRRENKKNILGQQEKGAVIVGSAAHGWLAERRLFLQRLA